MLKNKYNCKNIIPQKINLKKDYKIKLGKKGEELVEKYLVKNNYNIICKNFYTKKGEIDIIAIKDNLLIFIEVKTRTNYNYGSPCMAVNYKKKKHMKYAAKVFLYLNENMKNYEIRFDVIEVMINYNNGIINHIKNITI